MLVEKFNKHLFRAHKDKILNTEKEYFGEKRWTEDDFLLQTPDQKFNYSFIFFNANKTILGYVIASKKDSDYYIHRFVVFPEYLGCNVATDMMNFIKNVSRDFKSNNIFLKVHKENKRAIRFYEKNYLEVDRKEKEYLVMRVGTKGKI